MLQKKDTWKEQPKKKAQRIYRALTGFLGICNILRHDYDMIIYTYVAVRITCYYTCCYPSTQTSKNTILGYPCQVMCKTVIHVDSFILYIYIMGIQTVILIFLPKNSFHHTAALFASMNCSSQVRRPERTEDLGRNGAGRPAKKGCYK